MVKIIDAPLLAPPGIVGDVVSFNPQQVVHVRGAGPTSSVLFLSEGSHFDIALGKDELIALVTAPP